MDIRLPNITATKPTEQLEQMKSYMHQLVQELNWALTTISTNENGAVKAIQTESGKGINGEDAKATFDSIKALIIKSSDIVKAYESKMQIDFDTLYTAQSDFGNFALETRQQLVADASGIQQNFTNIETLTGQVTALRASQAYIRSGNLADPSDPAVYGVEVGETQESGFVKFARFTADGIYFYLPGASDAVAWMTGQKLYISNAEITGNLTIGHYMLDTSNGLAFKWIGG